MLSIDATASQWLVEWALPAALAVAGVATYVAGIVLGRRFRAQESEARTTVAPDTLADMLGTPPRRVYPIGRFHVDTCRFTDSRPRMAWVRMSHDTLELEGDSGHYIKIRLNTLQPFQLYDGLHRCINRTDELDLLMREGEHLARIEAVSAAASRPRVPRLRDR